MYETHNKQLIMLQAIKLCSEFCSLNGVPEPTIDCRPFPKLARGRRARTHGHYSPRKVMIRVYPDVCKVASSSPYSWTWPGYTADLTALGVVTHELGHHWHWVRSGQKSWKPLMNEYRRDVRPYESPVTGYGRKNASEGIAEAFKVFVTNPTLLLAVAPFHYAFFVKRELKPIVTAHWSEILAGSPRHLQAVRNKLERSPII